MALVRCCTIASFWARKYQGSKSFPVVSHTRRLFASREAIAEDSPSKFEQSLKDFESTGLHEVTPNSMSVDALALWLQKGQLNLAPKYQRGYVWGVEKASRFVVTVLCRRIVPAITLYEVETGVFDVVDGKQRLSTLLGFYQAGEDPNLHSRLVRDGLMPTDFDTLKELDENYESLNGLRFDMLNKDRQKAFSTFNIPVTKIPHKSRKQDVFSCYEDINSGGEELSAQQLRRAAYYGEYISLLDDLVLNKHFQRILNPLACTSGTYTPCPKDSDRELVLRAFAWERDGKNYKQPMKFFFNRELEYFDSLKDQQQKTMLLEKREEFEFIMSTWGNIFLEDDGAFRVWKKKDDGVWAWHNQISKPFVDVMYAVLVDLRLQYPQRQMYTKCKRELRDAIKSLFEDQKLSLTGKSGKKFLEQKDRLSRSLTNVLKKFNPSKGTRRFPDTPTLRKRLFKKQQGICSICGQTLEENLILDGSYANLDHIKPYSRGGKSEEKNAAIAHAECNRHKGAGTK